MILNEIIKQIAKQVFESESPTDIMFGNVISNSPLKINVEQRFTLTEEFLILTKNVIDYTIDVTINEASNVEKKKITIHNKLKKGDKVTLIRVQGGQQYIVLDKIYN